MLTRIYSLFLRLYPDSHRSEFGGEMVFVFEQRKAEAASKGLGHSVAFIAREFAGLVRDAFQAQMQVVPARNEPWIWSLEAPITAILLYSFWVWRSEEMGMWGFFFPGTYLLVLSLGGLGAWIIGRECVVVRAWHRWRRAAAVFLIFGFAVPIAARGVEEAWAKYLLAHDLNFSFRVPGIEVVVADAVPDQSQRRGLTFSRILTHHDGRPMTMIHHTNGNTPPYLLFGALVVGALALKSRRTALC